MIRIWYTQIQNDVPNDGYVLFDYTLEIVGSKVPNPYSFVTELAPP